jgi:hypothetical protein
MVKLFGLVTGVAICSGSQASVILDTFAGPTNGMTDFGHCINWAPLSVARAFEVSQSTTLDSITIGAFCLLPGATRISVEVRIDKGGNPGQVVESQTIYVDEKIRYTINSHLHPVLNPGRYHLVVSKGSPNDVAHPSNTWGWLCAEDLHFSSQLMIGSPAAGWTKMNPQARDITARITGTATSGFDFANFLQLTK